MRCRLSLASLSIGNLARAGVALLARRRIRNLFGICNRTIYHARRHTRCAIIAALPLDPAAQKLVASSKGRGDFYALGNEQVCFQRCLKDDSVLHAVVFVAKTGCSIASVIRDAGRIAVRKIRVQEWDRHTRLRLLGLCNCCVPTCAFGLCTLRVREPHLAGAVSFGATLVNVAFFVAASHCSCKYRAHATAGRDPALTSRADTGDIPARRAQAEACWVATAIHVSPVDEGLHARPGRVE